MNKEKIIEILNKLEIHADRNDYNYIANIDNVADEILDNSKQDTHKGDDVDFYSGKLNELRIKTYGKINELYNISDSSIRDIFNMGIDFAIKNTPKSIVSDKCGCENTMWLKADDGEGLLQSKNESFVVKQHNILSKPTNK